MQRIAVSEQVKLQLDDGPTFAMVQTAAQAALDR
jgi:hypothetical protein